MNVKNLFTSLAILAAFGIVASDAQAQNFPIQQGQFQQGQFQQGQFQQGQVIRGNMIQGTVIQGNMNQGRMMAQQPTAYSNVTMSEAEAAKPSIGATLSDAGASLVVRSIFTNGPAQNAGLTSGDMITKANGTAVQGVGAFNAMVDGMKSGDTVKLTKRNSEGKETDVELTLMSMGDIIKASTVPEAGAYDRAVQQTQVTISGLQQQIKNTQEDLEDLKKQLTTQESNLAELKTKAAKAAEDAKAMKAAEAAKRAALEAKLKKERDAADAAAGDSK